MRSSFLPRQLAVGAVLMTVLGCSDDETTKPEPLEPFTLDFAAVLAGDEVGCGDRLDGFGPGGTATVELSDLRFYVSNLRFHSDSGEILPVELDQNEFQYSSADGSVALIDLTGTAVGACAGQGLSFPEGTARTNTSITGSTYPDRVHRVTFDVGMPQSLMKATIANRTAEDAPSPLREMHWSWAYAYRHFVMNFTVTDGGVPGEGYVHVGSIDCGGDGTRALTDRSTCGKVNAPTVSLTPFHFGQNIVGVDIESVLADVDFQVAQSDTSDVLVPGVASHSSPLQPDTEVIFANFGVDLATGTSSEAFNLVFTIE